MKKINDAGASVKLENRTSTCGARVTFGETTDRQNKWPTALRINNE